MAHFYSITLGDMDVFLTQQGFSVIHLDGTREVVYGKLLARHICLRVFTGIMHTQSRLCGKDAIRVCVVRRYSDGFIKGIQAARRVHRVVGWKTNLQKRINEMTTWYAASLMR